MKLTASQRKDHRRAEDLLQSGKAHIPEVREEIIKKWHEGATHDNASASAFFTPYDMAFHLALNVENGGKLIDLCSGIGTLTAAILDHGQKFDEIVMLEINPDYAQIAQKLVPEAEVIVGSIYDEVLMAELASRRFRTAISNPPYGNVAKPTGARSPRFKGPAHYELIDIASDIADYGAFVLPQTACPFTYSGRQVYSEVENLRYEEFRQKTGITIEIGVAINTAALSGFRGTSMVVELVECDFKEARRTRQPTQSEFDLAA